MRFKYVLGDGFSDNGLYMSSSDIVKILNRLDAENRNLKQENKRLKNEIQNFIKGIQDSARLSAEAITKPFNRYYE